MKKQGKTIRYITVLLLFALTACGSATATPTAQATTVPAADVIAQGKIRPVAAANLSFQARGIVDLINVKIGDHVRGDDVLMRLGDAGSAETQLVAAQHAYDLLLRDAGGERARLWQAYQDAQKARGKAQKKWEDLNLDDIKTRIDNATNTVDDRKLELKKKQTNFDKYKDLSEEDSKRKSAADALRTAQSNLNQAVRDLESIERERDSVRATLDAALAAEAEAKYQFELTSDGPNKDQLELAKANLDAARAALDAYELRAPFDGIVADVAVHQGDQVGPEARAVSVSDPSKWIVETTDVTELEVVKISVGQPVSMTVDALPDLKLEGAVEDISASSVLQGGDVNYTVRIAVKEVDPRVRWGMTVEATFLAPQK